MFLEHEGKGTDLANQIVTYLLAVFLGVFYLQYLINQQKAGDEVLEEDTLPGEEEGWKKVLKKINGYNVMAAVTLLVKFVVTYNIILLLPDLSSRITVVILFVFLWSPFGIASLFVGRCIADVEKDWISSDSMSWIPSCCLQKVISFIIHSKNEAGYRLRLEPGEGGRVILSSALMLQNG